jgi:hypothetical protein
MYSATHHELGFASAATLTTTDGGQEQELAARHAASTKVDAELVAALAGEVEALRRRHTSTINPAVDSIGPA